MQEKTLAETYADIARKIDAAKTLEELVEAESAVFRAFENKAEAGAPIRAWMRGELRDRTFQKAEALLGVRCSKDISREIEECAFWDEAQRAAMAAVIAAIEPGQTSPPKDIAWAASAIADALLVERCNRRARTGQ